MKILLPLVVWCLSQFTIVRTEGGIGFGIKKEIFFLKLEDGYFGCQVNESTDVLQLYELSRLCDGFKDCYLGSDELQKELKCTTDCHTEKGIKCQNGACLDSQCHCNDGFGGCGCEMPDENECKYRPCDVFAHCTNTLGSFQCTCYPGYRGNGFQCEDINECEDPAIAARCVENAECCNIPANFFCRCLPGYQGDGEIECKDINECLDPDACGLNAICQNVPGNYTCSCPQGFEGNPFDKCVDINECDHEIICGPGAKCINKEGTFSCECPLGLGGDPYTTGCTTADECARNLCGRNALCQHTAGGFRCSCPPGFTGDALLECVDVNECKENPCGSNAECVNRNGSFVCICPEGYSGPPMQECLDINECGKPNACGINAKCINVPGSYKCICPKGFSGHGNLFCENVNECQHNPCGPNALCTDTIGSFVCTCKEDYTGDPFKGCVDINECAVLDRPCGSNAICENAVPGYNCICPQGYTAKPTPQIACEQVDVTTLCKSNYDCTNNAECIEGQCFCQKGFIAHEASCVDIDECQSLPCGPFATCTNSLGGFHCECESGYVGAPPRMPCKAPCEGVTCGPHAFCKPDGQEAYCICEEGWTFNPNDVAAGCVDINECDNVHGPFGRCGANALCTNTPGGFNCQCAPGFSGNPLKQCFDINECNSKEACGIGAVCVNQPGSFSCQCPEGTIPAPDPHTKCVGVVTCKQNSDCPGNAICDPQNRCLCPEPNIGNDCRHPCETILCGPNSQCMLINNEAKCLCSSGFTATPSGGCIDINECAANPCYPGAICNNEPGGFTCQCPGGFTGDPYKGGCLAKGQPLTCSSNKPCPPGEQCVKDEYVGDSICICSRGYARDIETGGCRDIDECTELREKPACGINAICKNMPGSYDCQCPPGFNGNPFSLCEECNSLECQCQPPYQIVDGNCILASCSNGGKCPSGAECITIAGGVSYCACPKGFRTQQDGSCLDIDECTEGRPACSYGAVCLNTVGGHKCECPKGYTGDPYNGICTPIQVRCVHNGDCRPNEQCIEPGECVCPLPFYTDIQDDNKCKTPCDRFPCGINAECTPSDPPKCLCQPGYHGDPYQGCSDIDECASEPCAYGAHCLNEKGGFKCVCPQGWTGDAYKSGCVTSASLRAECHLNSDCAGQLSCVAGACVNPCSTLPCGPNAYCEPDDNHRAWCKCKVGFIEGPNGECVSQCSHQFCGKGAQCIVTTFGPTCKCVEGFIGNPFPGGECVPDICSPSNPCAEPNICIGGRCKARCEGVVCGIGAVCDKNTNKCVCEPFFVGNPDYICMPPINAPLCNPGCGKNAHCEYGFANLCVCNPGTVGNPYEECGPLKKMSCSATSCGKGAICKQGYNSIECVCPPGFAGNPYIQCQDIDECSRNACGAGAVCINSLGSYDCRCKEGYAGNPFIMCSQIDRGICTNPSQCHCGNNVHCPVGYTCQNGKCKNLCEGIKCGPRAGCNNGLCICPPGHVGDPTDITLGCRLEGQCQNDFDCHSTEICFQFGKGVRKCLDGCSKLQCGPNALCVTDAHRSSCICADGFVGHPGDLLNGCRPEIIAPKGECDTNKDCAKGLICAVSADGLKSCVNPCNAVACGFNEACIIDPNGNPVCTCVEGYVWNPIKSVCEKPSLPDCTKNQDCPQTSACVPDALNVLKCVPVCTEFTCPANAVCVTIAHEGHCQCLPDFTGNPNDRNGCKPIAKNQCNTDAQCLESEICRKDSKTNILSCQPACESIICGPNAVCIVNNHVARCQCPPGPYAGDPNDHTLGCKTVPCVYNIDCPAHQLCNRLTHTCFDVCEEQSCGNNAVCIAEDHEATCQCPPGFKGNPLPEIECVPTELCNPNPCHPTAICEGTSLGYVCKCPPETIGDPKTSGCRPKGNCPNGDSDCPPQSVCLGNRCVNPCDDFCGANALCTMVNRKPVCSCPTKFKAAIGGPIVGCIRSSSACVSDADCSGDVCINGQCKAVCRNTADCSAGEKCIYGTCSLPCASHSQCLENQACINGMCTIGCRSNKDCQLNQACIAYKCQDPCKTEGACGPNAICSCEGHNTVCACPPGFEGVPEPQQGCVRVPSPCSHSKQCLPGQECVSNICVQKCASTAECAIGERCFETNCVKVCHNDGNCLVGELCIDGICQPGCAVDSDCVEGQVCINTKCRCGAGFTNTDNGCLDIDECKDVPCHFSAICNNTPGSYRCQCPSGTVGDPYLEPGCLLPNQCNKNSDCIEALSCVNGQCSDPCLNVHACGPNAICNVFEHLGTCSCPPGHLGDPTDLHLGCFRVECVINEDCSDDRYCDKQSNKCANPCDSINCGKGTCQTINHRGLCTCFEGYAFTDGKCTDINECLTKPCHKTAICQNIPGSYHCSCAEGLVGDPIKGGCRKPGDCFTNSDCPFTAACINNRCTNPCTVPGVCGKNAQCLPVAHSATCKCPPQTKGDPKRECLKLQCTDSNDCPLTKTCIDYRCVEPCSLPNVCGKNADCVSTNHIGLCSCQPGYTGDPLLGCVPVQYCSHDVQCSSGTRCNNGICTAECRNTRDCIGDQLCINKLCQPTCRSNSSCPDFQFCQNSICVQEVRCRSNSDCDISSRCIQNSLGQAECQNACDDLVLCGRNAECHTQNHEAICTCKKGFQGNPIDEKIGCQPVECYTDNDCSNDKLCDGYTCKIACLVSNPCGENALCSAEKHKQVCYCQPGYTGNAIKGCKLIDFCADHPCGPGAKCANSHGSYKCHCPLGTVGDPYNDGCRAPVECDKDSDCPLQAECINFNDIPKCRDVCEKIVCGANAECRARNHVGSCVCRDGYEGNPNDGAIGCRPKPISCISNSDCPLNSYCYGDICRPPCQYDEECSLTEKCIQGQCNNPCDLKSACGMNAECTVLNHYKQCSCPPGFTGNHDVECVRVPLSCNNDVDCSEGYTCKDGVCLPICNGDNDCAFNEKCMKGRCMLTCRVDNDCFLGHICLYNMCLFGCHSDEDCSASEQCINNRCTNPCAASPCGPNALCSVANQRSSCSCSDGFVPSPTARIACLRFPAQPCVENRDCSIGSTCHENSCQPICSTDDGCLSNERCDLSSGICKPLCRRDDDCRSGEVCEGLICVTGCRSDAGCPLNKACVNNKCYDLCLSPTACGTNAVCSMKGHQKQCHCPPPLIGDANVGCQLPVTSCNTQVDCLNSQKCFDGLCRAACLSDSNCLADERCVKGICKTICNSDAKCGRGQICENRLCIAGCRSDIVCPDNQACIDKQCRDPCDGTSTCGNCAHCSVINHGIQCSCPADFIGNPLISCTKAPLKCQGRNCECDEAGYCTRSCGKQADCDCGEKCVGRKCRQKCSGHSSCPQGHICSEGACIPGCRSDSDCANDQACRNKKCKNPCTTGKSPCGLNALCKVSEHRTLCLCPDGYKGEPSQFCQPYECLRDDDCEASKFCSPEKACKNPCLEVGACGVNAQCKVINRRKQCSCPPGLIGNPEVECRQSGRECLNNPCGENSRCRDVPGGFECSCEVGCTGDPYKGCICQGTLVNLCKDLRCGHFAQCRVTDNLEPECFCPAAYPIGDPYIECSADQSPVDCRTTGCGKGSECIREGIAFVCKKDESECTSDLQCPNEKACISGRCIDPCSLRGACGENALCRVVLHKPRCSCPQCYIGKPFTECRPDPKCEKVEPRPASPSILCDSNEDCPDNKACGTTRHCSDPCIMYGITCDLNKKCEARNHKPVCVCKGFVVNNIGELTCKPDRIECTRDNDCASNLACINNKCQNPCLNAKKSPCTKDKVCEVLDHKPVCICLDDCNPTFSICLRDSGCPSHQACKNYRCVNPCQNTTCPQNAPCYVEEHTPVCKFCPPGFVTDQKYGCLKVNVSGCKEEKECTGTETCIQGLCLDLCARTTCGQRAVCKAKAHKSFCFCPPGYHGDPKIECYPIFDSTDLKVTTALATNPAVISDIFATEKPTQIVTHDGRSPKTKTTERDFDSPKIKPFPISLKY